MALLLTNGLPERVVQVLKDFLPTETARVDTAMADGITTPTIAATDFYAWDARVIKAAPSCTIRVVASELAEAWPDGFGQRVHSRHRLEVVFHVSIETGATDVMKMQKLLQRYIAGAISTISIMKEGLQTTADPTRRVSLVEWAGPATYGPEADQAEGTVIRTATLPIQITTIEAR